MQLRSLKRLDLSTAWDRTLHWARGRTDVPDRMPFEAVHRLYRDGPTLRSDHRLAPITRVMATKGSGTARPFVRLSPFDLCLYQALVDQMAEAIERTLRPREEVMGYRQTVEKTLYPFEGTPTWRTFIESVRAELESGRHEYALNADIASFFVYVEVDELERQLLESGAPPACVRDLADLLRAWNALGVQGIPQGVYPSSALGNFYLHGLDDLLARTGYTFRRYVDDLWIFTDSYAEGREVLDVIERYLYEYRLSLGGEKSNVWRRETALAETETAKEALDRRKESVRDALEAAADDPYIDSEFLPDPGDIDHVAIQAEYDELRPAILAGTYPRAARSRMLEIYRELEALGDPLAIAEVPEILVRLPDLTGQAMRYVAAAASSDSEAAAKAFVEVLDPDRFHREQELLQIFRAALRLPVGSPSQELVALLGAHAHDSKSELAQARAVLAWGAQSPPTEFDVADRFWTESRAQWRPYALLSIQRKAVAERDARFERWSGDGRFLRRLTESVKEQPFRWKHL